MDDRPDPELALSVIIPVFDQEQVIVDNVRVVAERVAAGLDGGFEVIVVSDGSLDSTAERVLASEIPGVSVLHYDRNLGKGYAIKTGARAARGRWVGFVDADLDLDPAALPDFVAVGERDGVDFVIGSKRHRDSRVHYPRARVVTSWFYQQLVRVLFRLHVRDTQVGLKVFRREIADEVVPLLLVKRFAFDIELLAVARAYGYGRITEMPIVLDYRFTGSGVRSLAVAHALVDTLAVFYRLRILRYYQRQRANSGAEGWVAPRGYQPTVSIIRDDDVAARRRASEHADAEILAFLEPGARPSANWLTATTPFFARPELAVVVTPQLAPPGGRVRDRAAAAVAESRIGGGSLYFRFTPGRIRFVSDFPARSLIVRREHFLALPSTTPPESVVRELAVSGRSALYLPEASVVSPSAPLFRPHLTRIAAYGRSRGQYVRARGLAGARPSTVGVIALLIWTLAGWILILLGSVAFDVWLAVWCAYAAVVVIAAGLGGLRFRSLGVALSTAVGLVLTHATYAIAFVRGWSQPAGVRMSSPDRA